MVLSTIIMMPPLADGDGLEAPPPHSLADVPIRDVFRDPQNGSSNQEQGGTPSPPATSNNQLSGAGVRAPLFVQAVRERERSSPSTTRPCSRRSGLARLSRPTKPLASNGALKRGERGHRDSSEARERAALGAAQARRRRDREAPPAARLQAQDAVDHDAPAARVLTAPASAGARARDGLERESAYLF